MGFGFGAAGWLMVYANLAILQIGKEPELPLLAARNTPRHSIIPPKNTRLTASNLPFVTINPRVLTLVNVIYTSISDT